jgi:hypothetical protein
MPHHSLKYILFPATLVLMLLVVVAGCQRTDNAAVIEEYKKIAGELRDNKLYEEAINEYKIILALENLDNKQRANFNYLIGKIYFEDLKDYEKAAAYYVRARAYDPNGTFMDEASRNLVASLEKMGQYLDAKREMSAVTDVGAQPKDKTDVAVARIDGKPIWRSQIEEQLQSLPPEQQKQFMSPEAKRNFVRQYVAMELLYHAALREGYDKDEDIIRKKDLFLKQLLVEKFVINKVMPEVKIDTMDVRNFYLANKDSRYEGAPFDSVKAQVFLDYQSDKANAAYSNYIAKLSQAEKVEFLDQNIK